MPHLDVSLEVPNFNTHAFCLFCENFNVKCPVSGSVFSFIQNIGLCVFYFIFVALISAVWSKVSSDKMLKGYHI